jgi:hypothetical protein
MKAYEEVVYDLGTTQAQMMLAPNTAMRRYISADTVAYLFDRDVENVELDIQMAYKMAIQDLTKHTV